MVNIFETIRNAQQQAEQAQQELTTESISVETDGVQVVIAGGGRVEAIHLNNLLTEHGFYAPHEKFQEIEQAVVNAVNAAIIGSQKLANDRMSAAVGTVQDFVSSTFGGFLGPLSADEVEDIDEETGDDDSPELEP